MGALTPKEITKARSRFEAGDAFSRIANDLQCHETSLRYHARKQGWQRNVPVVSDISVQKEMPPIGNAVEKKATPRPIDEIGKEVRSRLAANIETTLERVSTLSPDDIREEVQLETVLASVTKRAATVFGWAEQQSNVLVSVGLLGALPDRETDVTPLREES
jgi:hypothetical protein